MPDATAPEEPARPTDSPRRIYVLWGLGLAFLLALGLVCWLLVVPVLQVRAVLRNVQLPGARYALETPTPEKAIEKLGGPALAARKLALYYRLPAWAAERREGALYLLSCCGASSVPALARIALSKADVSERAFAIQAIGKLGNSARAAVPALVKIVERKPEYLYRGYVRTLGSYEDPWLEAVKALGQIGREATVAVPLLETMAKERSGMGVEVRAALRKITGREYSEPPQMILKMDPMEVEPAPQLEE